MERAEYDAFLERLVADLEQEPHVLGIVALGSTARTARQPDRWSDHDVWIVVEAGRAESLRSTPAWLPDPRDVVLFFRETAHGVKALYRSGHLVEAAIFEPDELAVTRANDYAILLDRCGLEERMRSIRAVTVDEHTAEAATDDHLVGQVLTLLLVGSQRHARGERLSGHEFVKGHALGHLLTLMARHLEPDDPAAPDDLNVYRRFERAFPDPARRLAAALLLPAPRAALGLLEILETTVAPTMSGFPYAASAAVRAEITVAVG